MKLTSALFLVLVSSAFASAKVTVNGNAGGVLASGVWEESHQAVSLFCVYTTNSFDVVKGSRPSCFLTEVQALAKDSTEVTTSVFIVQTWDSHGLTATAISYANKNGDQTTATDPDAVKRTFRLVVDFDGHSLTKHVETPVKTFDYHLK